MGVRGVLRAPASRLPCRCRPDAGGLRGRHVGRRGVGGCPCRSSASPGWSASRGSPRSPDPAYVEDPDRTATQIFHI